MAIVNRSSGGLKRINGGVTMCEICRRNFLRGLAGFSAASTLPSSLLAEGAQNPEGVRRPPADIRPGEPCNGACPSRLETFP